MKTQGTPGPRYGWPVIRVKSTPAAPGHRADERGRREGPSGIGQKVFLGDLGTARQLARCPAARLRGRDPRADPARFACCVSPEFQADLQFPASLPNPYSLGQEEYRTMLNERAAKRATQQSWLGSENAEAISAGAGESGPHDRPVGGGHPPGRVMTADRVSRGLRHVTARRDESQLAEHIRPREEIRPADGTAVAAAGLVHRGRESPATGLDPPRTFARAPESSACSYAEPRDRTGRSNDGQWAGSCGHAPDRKNESSRGRRVRSGRRSGRSATKGEIRDRGPS